MSDPWAGWWRLYTSGFPACQGPSPPILMNPRTSQGFPKFPDWSRGIKQAAKCFPMPIIFFYRELNDARDNEQNQSGCGDRNDRLTIDEKR
jgi:hypothetical protein